MPKSANLILAHVSNTNYEVRCRNKSSVLIHLCYIVNRLIVPFAKTARSGLLGLNAVAKYIDSEECFITIMHFRSVLGRKINFCSRKIAQKKRCGLYVRM